MNKIAYQSTSDLIESCVREIPENSEVVEIRRIEMADLFNCIPSQVDYVINTRSTIQHGYLVESKRGGGDYIRITRVRISNRKQLLEQVDQLSDDTINEKNAFAIIQKLYEDQIITKKEGDLMLGAITENTLSFNEYEDHARVRTLRTFLERLSYEDGK